MKYKYKNNWYSKDELIEFLANEEFAKKTLEDNIEWSFSWFGDWENSPKTASKVVDENGEPMVVYHGTGEIINVFDKKKAHDTEGRKFNVGTGKGVFSFTNDYNTALSWAERSVERKQYGIISNSPNVLSVFLNFKNPISRNDFESRLDIEFEGYMFRTQKERDKKISKIYKDYKKEKIDGLISDWGEYTAFEPNQIKLATGTNTTFDSNNPDIRYADGGYLSEKLTIDEVENLLGRKLHWWNDDTIILGNVKYKKIYLQPLYEKVI
jgi:hypothetical protein